MRTAYESTPLYFLIHTVGENDAVWEGDDMFLCTPDSRFDITSDHEGPYDKRGYIEIDMLTGDRLIAGHTVNSTPDQAALAFPNTRAAKAG